MPSGCASSCRRFLAHALLPSAVCILVTLYVSELALFDWTAGRFCSEWPTHSSVASDAPPLRLLVLADTHLLGRRKGHWLDRLRREHAMKVSFQAALHALPLATAPPDAVVLVGDVFDEGQWDDALAWEGDFGRLVDMFHLQVSKESAGLVSVLPAFPDTPLPFLVVVGNHDVGFHHVTTPELLGRFERAFGPSTEMTFMRKQASAPSPSSALPRASLHADSVQMHADDGYDCVEAALVRINSMAMRGDGCGFCDQSEASLRNASLRLLGKASPLWEQSRLAAQGQLSASAKDGGQSRAARIVLSHFPFFKFGNSTAGSDGEFVSCPAGPRTYRVPEGSRTLVAFQSRRTQIYDAGGMLVSEWDVSLAQLEAFRAHVRSSTQSGQLAVALDSGIRVAPYDGRVEDWETLSQSATLFLQNLLRPGAVFSGHSHESCVYVHPDGAPEITVGSFNRRNAQSTVYVLATLYPRQDAGLAVFCFAPSEQTVFWLYGVGGAGAGCILLAWLARAWPRRHRPREKAG